MGIKIKPADKAFGDCLKAAHDNICVVCGRQGRIEASHIHSRRHRTVRWCKENCLPKCSTCHRWWHENPTESGAWFIGKYGDGLDQILREKIRSHYKIPKTDEPAIAAHYRKQTKEIQEKRNAGAVGYVDYVSYQ